MVSLLFVLGAASCSNNDSPTAPGGGGGGGGGSQFNFGPFAVGQSESFTFANAGNFGYHCIPHRTMGMTGTVQVTTAAVQESALVQIAPSGLAFAPAVSQIKPGGHVRWVNVSTSTIHTVTSD